MGDRDDDAALRALPIKELKRLLRDHGVDATGAVEKSDLVRLALDQGIAPGASPRADDAGAAAPATAHGGETGDVQAEVARTMEAVRRAVEGPSDTHSIDGNFRRLQAVEAIVREARAPAAKKCAQEECAKQLSIIAIKVLSNGGIAAPGEAPDPGRAMYVRMLASKALVYERGSPSALAVRGMAHMEQGQVAFAAKDLCRALAQPRSKWDPSERDLRELAAMALRRAKNLAVAGAWELLPGPTPPPRFYAASCASEDGRTHYVVGGRAPDDDESARAPPGGPGPGDGGGRLRSDVWVLDAAADPPVWSQVSVSGPPGPALEHAAACCVGTWLVVMGGVLLPPRGRPALNNAVWVLDVSRPSPTWQKVSDGGRPLQRRPLAFRRGDAVYVLSGMVGVPVAPTLRRLNLLAAPRRSGGAGAAKLEARWTDVAMVGPAPPSADFLAAWYDPDADEACVIARPPPSAQSADGSPTPTTAQVHILQFEHAEGTWRQEVLGVAFVPAQDRACAVAAGRAPPGAGSSGDAARGCATAWAFGGWSRDFVRDIFGLVADGTAGHVRLEGRYHSELLVRVPTGDAPAPTGSAPGRGASAQFAATARRWTDWRIVIDPSGGGGGPAGLSGASVLPLPDGRGCVVTGGFTMEQAGRDLRRSMAKVPTPAHVDGNVAQRNAPGVSAVSYLLTLTPGVDVTSVEARQEPVPTDPPGVPRVPKQGESSGGKDAAAAPAGSKPGGASSACGHKPGCKCSGGMGNGYNYFHESPADEAYCQGVFQYVRFHPEWRARLAALVPAAARVPRGGGATGAVVVQWGRLADKVPTPATVLAGAEWWPKARLLQAVPHAGLRTWDDAGNKPLSDLMEEFESSAHFLLLFLPTAEHENLCRRLGRSPDFSRSWHSLGYPPLPAPSAEELRRLDTWVRRVVECETPADINIAQPPIKVCMGPGCSIYELRSMSPVVKRFMPPDQLRRRTVPAFAICARCHSAWYCGKACQTSAWKAGHKKQCRAPDECQPANG